MCVVRQRVSECGVAESECVWLDREWVCVVRQRVCVCGAVEYPIDSSNCLRSSVE